jgi:hypothetical protein
MLPIAPICRRNLLALARAYSKQEGIPLATVWRHAYGDAKIGERLKSRRGSVTLRTYDELVAWFFNALDDHRFPNLEPLDQPFTGHANRGDANGTEARSD